MSKPISKLVFNIAKPKAKTKREQKGKILARKVYCVCVYENDEFKARIRIVSTAQRVTNIVIPFSPDSHDCRGKEKVFSKKLDKYGKRICYIRNADQYRVAPKTSILYTPFCEDWVYSGNIIQINGRRFFDIKEAIWHKDFIKEDLDIKEEDMKL